MSCDCQWFFMNVNGLTAKGKNKNKFESWE
jgi:hypothetical protein